MSLPIETISTVLSPAVSYDLTDLDTVRTELQIDANDTSDDAWLTQAIGQVSGSIQRYTNRVFPPEFVQDLVQFGRDPFQGARFGGENEIPLERFPLIAVASVVQALPSGATRSLVAGTDFIANLARGRLLRLGADGRLRRWETLPLTVQYLAGYGALVQETDTVPAGSPYAITVSQASAFSCAQSVAYASGSALQAVAANPAQGQFSVSSEGVFTFNAADASQTLTFAYGVSNIPADLVEQSLKLITSRYDAKDRDSWLMLEDQPGIGSKRYWVGGTPGQSGPFPPDIAAALDDYRVPGLA